MPEIDKKRFQIPPLSRRAMIVAGVSAAVALACIWQFWNLNSNLKSSTKIMQGLRDEVESLRKEKQSFIDASQIEKAQRESLNEQLTNVTEDRDTYAQRQSELEKKVQEADAAIQIQNKKAGELEKRLKEANERIQRQRRASAVLEGRTRDARSNPGMSAQYVKLVENEWLAATAETEALKKDLDKTLAELADQNKERAKLRYETATMHYNLAVILAEKGDHAAAIREYEKVIESRPEDADAHYNLGILYDDHMLDSVRALEHYRQYIRLAPASTEASRVREWIQQKEFDESFRNKVMRKNP